MREIQEDAREVLALGDGGELKGDVPFFRVDAETVHLIPDDFPAPPRPPSRAPQGSFLGDGGLECPREQICEGRECEMREKKGSARLLLTREFYFEY